jgi:hypothetical protein
VADDLRAAAERVLGAFCDLLWDESGYSRQGSDEETAGFSLALEEVRARALGVLAASPAFLAWAWDEGCGTVWPDVQHGPVYRPRSDVAAFLDGVGEDRG